MAPDEGASTPTEARLVSGPALRGDAGPRLLRFLLEQGADEFSITVMALQDTQAPFADAFEDELGPHELPPARRPVLARAGGTATDRVIRRWRYTRETLDRLLGFLDTDIVHCPAGPDGWLEDLVVYRRGEIVLGIVSHEQEGVLRLTTVELAEVAALDIPFEVTAKWTAG